MRLYWFIVFSLFMPFCYGQKMLPSEPVHAFKIPYFNADGKKAWDLKGDQGRYVEEDWIEVTGMEIRTFPGEDVASDLVIKSPRADIFVSKKSATSDDDIMVFGDNYMAFGKEWEWLGNENKIQIHRDVEVVFDGTLGIQTINYENKT